METNSKNVHLNPGTCGKCYYFPDLRANIYFKVVSGQQKDGNDKWEVVHLSVYNLHECIQGAMNFLYLKQGIFCYVKLPVSR